MASGSEIHLNDLPPELKARPGTEESSLDWEDSLKRWTERQLSAGKDKLLDDALPRLEKIMLDAALRYTGGRRQDAARLLGWGRNTLTRKIKDHGM